MALQALLKISNVKGESNVTGFSGDDGWIEIQGWDWEVECETSWTKGSGASVGKPNPGKMNWEHYFDSSATTVMFNMCGGQAFETMDLIMLKSTGASAGKTGQKIFFHMHMEGVFITKVTHNATDEGNVLQKVEMVFKTVDIGYKKQFSTGKQAGKLDTYQGFYWEIPTGILDTSHAKSAEAVVDPA
jgi:type VI secretion system secreted protein Hcp